MMVALVLRGQAKAVWVVVTLAVGALSGAVVVRGAERMWRASAERVDAAAEALEHGRPPLHLLHAEPGLMARAERRLLEAVDLVHDQLAALTGQRDEFEAILRGMIEAVVVTGARGELVMLNGAARRLFALAPDADYAGRDFVELCRDPRLQDLVSRTQQSGGALVTTSELSIQYPAERSLQVSAAPVRAGAGAGAAWVFVFHDITQLKNYETLRTDFIANLTHELRTPLAALRGYAETLTEGVEDADTQRRFLGIIERQASRLSRLIDDLISLSDLERGLAALKFETLDPARVVGEAVELMRGQAERKGVVLEQRSDPELAQVAADRDRMHQLMLNLLDNAIKYTPPEGRVTVEAHAAGDPDGKAGAGVEFVVSDTGEGIPAADISRLTERFYRVDRARSREMGGTGLGLAIVKHILQLHHGKLRIASRLGEGTVVTVWLPAAGSASLAAAG